MISKMSQGSIAEKKNDLPQSNFYQMKRRKLPDAEMGESVTFSNRRRLLNGVSHSSAALYIL